jgi:phage terminase large subunit GpA-like protein
MVGTDTAKDTLFQRLAVKQPGPGYIHFSKHLPLDWFKGFTAEVRRTVRTSTGVKYRWVKTAQRNEPLDTSVYALFASQMLDHYKLSEAQWARLANDLLPDLFDLPPALVSATPEPLSPLQPGEIEVRDAAGVAEPPASEAAAAAPSAPLAPLGVTPGRSTPAPARRRPPAAPAAAPVPFVSPFAKPEWSSRL